MKACHENDYCSRRLKEVLRNDQVLADIGLENSPSTAEDKIRIATHYVERYYACGMQGTTLP
jgi:hypothetical protein